MNAQEEREPIDIIRDAMTDQEFIGFLKGKIIEGIENGDDAEDDDQIFLRKMMRHVLGHGPDPRMKEDGNFKGYQKKDFNPGAYRLRLLQDINSGVSSFKHGQKGPEVDFWDATKK